MVYLIVCQPSGDRLPGHREAADGPRDDDDQGRYAQIQLRQGVPRRYRPHLCERARV